jgi:hypothetical protein
MVYGGTTILAKAQEKNGFECFYWFIFINLMVEFWVIFNAIQSLWAS